MKGKRTKPKHNPFHQKAPSTESKAPIVFPMRLNKYIAKCGVCSRRKAVELVTAGKIKVNDVVEKTPYTLIQADDVVIYEGAVLKPEETLIYLLLNKPRDVITTTSDERNRKTVLEHIDWQGSERLFTVGRLDRQTTGLLIITNDGDLTKKLSHPSHEVKKKYEVLLNQDIRPEHFDLIVKGHTLEDGLVPVHELKFVEEKRRDRLEITVSVGRNRIIRRLFESFDYQIKGLDRTYFGGLTKKNLPRGRHRALTPREVIMLKHFS